jgi:hypothetical protein
MSESTSEAAILISISWQALSRLKSGNWMTFKTDSIVTKFFASVYLEACLSYIIKDMGIKDEMEQFYGNNGNPQTNIGLGDKMIYFYAKNIEKTLPNTKKKLRKNRYLTKLGKYYTNFLKIKEYRDTIAHGGNFNLMTETLQEITDFRNCAKAIVDKLCENAKTITGHDVKRDIDYWMAIDEEPFPKDEKSDASDDDYTVDIGFGAQRSS